LASGPARITFHARRYVFAERVGPQRKFRRTRRLGMNQEQIKTLIDALAASDLAQLEYSENGSTLRLFKQAALAGVTADETRPNEASRAAPTGAASTSRTDCLAPLFGVLHLQPSPGEPVFVRAGQAVVAGQTLCVIEAMKVFNEVRAERDATVAAVLAVSGEEVEAGQPLFRFD
jgi:acetyl-CoA carboxylase biotin carboxyl carrier protein